MPIATGVGLSMKLQGIDRICLCIFGDGAANEGSFHEAINMAAVWDLPVVFLCENNQYGMSMSTQRAMRNETVAQRAAAYGIPGELVDGNDVLAENVGLNLPPERAFAASAGDADFIDRHAEVTNDGQTVAKTIGRPFHDTPR